MPPLFNDSRNVDNFGKVLESDEAVEYLERTPNPRFELAVRKAGVGEQEIISLVSSASDNIQLVLTDAHIYKQSAVLHRSVQRLGKDFAALLNVLPSIKGNIVKEIVDACNS